MKVGDLPVEFRATRDQARLIRDALLAHSKSLASTGRTKGGRLRSVENLRRSLLLSFLAEQITLMLATSPTQPTAKRRRR